MSTWDGPGFDETAGPGNATPVDTGLGITDQPALGDPFDDGGFADEIANVHAADWSFDLDSLWGADTPDALHHGADFDLPS